MAAKAKPLRGRSEFVRPDGTVVPVRDYDGNLVIDPQEWEQIKKQIGQNVGRIVSEIVTQHPEKKAAFGIPEGQNSATVRLMDLLQEKAPSAAATATERKRN